MEMFNFQTQYHARPIINRKCKFLYKTGLVGLSSDNLLCEIYKEFADSELTTGKWVTGSWIMGQMGRQI